MVLRIATVLMLAMLTLPYANAVGATFDVGATGRCYDDDGSGGQTSLIVKSGPSVSNFDPVAAANAVLAFVLLPTGIPSGNGCSSTNGTDYLEAHVLVDAVGTSDWDVQVKVCYAGNAMNIPNENCYPTAP